MAPPANTTCDSPCNVPRSALKWSRYHYTLTTAVIIDTVTVLTTGILKIKHKINIVTLHVLEICSPLVSFFNDNYI